MANEPVMRMTFVMVAIIGLVAVVGIVFLVRALANGSGRQVAWMLGGSALVGLMLFLVRAQKVAVSHVPVVVQENSVNFGNLPGSVHENWLSSSIESLPKMLLMLVGLALVVGILLLISNLARSSGGRTTLVVGAIGLVILAMFFVGYLSLNYSGEMVVHEDYGGHRSGRHGGRDSNQYQGIIDPRINISREEVAKPKLSDSTVTEPETKTFTPDSGEPKPNNKPAWLMQGKQTVNGNPQFPVSSELFATVTECQRDLDRRLPQLIAEEIPYLAAESFQVPLLPDEVKRLTADSFTEEIPLAQGTWYRVHLFIKVDQAAWQGIYNRFQQAKTLARLETLAASFGGLMLVIGVVYLVLRRTPRVVDPGMETFRTT